MTFRLTLRFSHIAASQPKSLEGWSLALISVMFPGHVVVVQFETEKEI